MRSLRCSWALASVMVLAIGAASRSDELPIAPGTSSAPAPLDLDVIKQATPLPPPLARTDRHLQTINWLARPKAATLAASPIADTPADALIPAVQQEPALPLPLAPVTEESAPPGRQLCFEVWPGTTVQLEGVMRGYWRDDQRIYWSGLEHVFGAEGVLRPLIQTEQGSWTVSGQAEFFLNQKYGSSILSDPGRDLYRANFQIDPFEIFQMFGQFQYRDWVLRIGKSRTPFGGYYSPNFINSLMDAPFLRTEVIPWTETGAFLHYEPGAFTGDVAIVNGEPNLDTNSSKGIVARVGLNRDFWTIGASVKYQDGISSEFHKRYNNIAGLDYCLRYGRLVCYGEVTYDQYGFHRDFFAFGNPLNLGVRDLYHRDVFKPPGKSPVSGVGYYVAAGYRGERWLFDGSFGTYFPERLGIPAHDAYINRGVVKAAFSVTPNFQIYALGLVENVRPRDGILSNDNPFAVLAGMQLAF